MCSKEEYRERLEVFEINNSDADRLIVDTSRSFSIFEISKKTMKPNYKLAIKRFRRAANHELK